MRDVVIVDSVRTGLAKSFRGSFNLTRPDDQVAHCIDALLARNGEINPSEVEDVIVGAASQIGEQGGNLARLAVILSNLPTSAAGTTISRACSSGLNSIAMAATQIASGYSEVMIAGGVESISAGQRQTVGRSDSHPFILEKSPDIFMAMGNTAEVVARRYNVTREAQDKFALLSQERTAAAQKAGFFDDEIVEVCNDLANRGMRVIVTGLDMDYKGNPFGPMPALMATAEYVTKVHAVCTRTGNLAHYSHRTSDQKELVFLGEKNSYEPLSRSAFNLALKEQESQSYRMVIRLSLLKWQTI